MLEKTTGMGTAMTTKQNENEKHHDHEQHEEYSDGNNSNLVRAGCIFSAVTIFSIGLTAPFIFSRSPLPYMATPGRKIRGALKHVLKQQGRFQVEESSASSQSHSLQAKRKGMLPVFVDLGSGDGEGVLQAARLGYKSIGIELNFTLWAFSNIRRQLFWSSHEKKNSKIILGSFFDYNLHHDFQASTVMIFGVAPLMKSLSQKLKHELPVGSCVLSYRFGIPLAYDGADDDLLAASIVYDHQEMRVYQVSKPAASGCHQATGIIPTPREEVPYKSETFLRF